MSMPPQGAFLPDHIELVGEIFVWQDRELCEKWHPISPAVPKLLHSVPASRTTNTFALSEKIISPICSGTVVVNSMRGATIFFKKCCQVLFHVLIFF
jgi:hypothetical protein